MKHGKLDEYKFEENRIEFSLVTSEPKKAGLYSLFILFLVSACLPIVVVLLWGDRIKFGFVITLFVFWGAAVYFLRLILWNLYGKEVFLITTTNCMSYQDYQLFKDRKMTKPIVEFTPIIVMESLLSSHEKINVAELDHENDYASLRLLFGSDELIESHIEISISELIKLTEDLKTDYSRLEQNFVD